MIRRLFALPLVLIGCSGDAPPASIRTDSAGIEIVRYAGPDREIRIDLTEEFRLGGSETDPNQSFYSVFRGTVATDAAGNIYVLDSPAYRVVVFGPGGEFLRAMGRQGGGPGELAFPAGLVVSADGHVGVIDFGKRGIVRWDADGNALPIEPLPAGFFGGGLHIEKDVTVLSGSTEIEGRRFDVLFRIAGGDTAIVARVDPGATRPIQLESCGMAFSGMPALFTPTIRWSAAGDRIAVATGAGYDIAIQEDGREVRRIRRDVAPAVATEELAVRDLGEGMTVRTEGGVRTCDPREVVEQRGFADVIPVTGTLAFAPDGSLWVERGGVRDEPRAIDRFDADGDYLGTLPAGTPFPLLFLPDGRVAVAEKDDLDVVRLVIYRITG